MQLASKVFYKVNYYSNRRVDIVVTSTKLNLEQYAQQYNTRYYLRFPTDVIHMYKDIYD